MLEQCGVLGGVKVGIYASNKKYLDVLYVFSFNLLMQILLMVYGNLELASDSDICSYLWLAMLFQREKKSISFGGANMQLISLRCQREPNQVLEVVITIRAIRPFAGR